MKLIPKTLRNIKNLFPYFLIISIYFFIVNIEERKQTNNNKIINNQNNYPEIESLEKNKNLRVIIPVIPYKE
tara:strand:- start:207 stop:422 length:216 start_codon:yes stop_codon:yes gene_type:complete